jgi:myo-inositol-1(or 4)-monophosphatase
MARRSANLEMMVRAVMKAARGLVRDFGEVEQLQVSRKGPGDFVSNADRRAEQILKAELKRARPEFGFLMEESGEEVGSQPQNRWIVDPLDGTTNFLHGMPHWAISVALEQFGEITAGVVFDPIRDELFWADKGSGAYVNDRRLRVSARTALDQALVGCGLPVLDWKGREMGFTAQMNAMADKVAGLRRLGTASLDLAWIAAGRQDGFWEYGLKPWDIAAGILIVREAGGRIGKLEGDEDLLAEGTLVAANGALYPQLVEVLQAAGSA